MMTIRFATENDCALILHFIRDLAEYEKMADQVVASEELLREWIFEKQKAEVLFVCEEGKELGFALFFHNFSTFLGRAGIYLEDLFVLPEYRGKGYGKALLKKLAQIAVELNFSCPQMKHKGMGSDVGQNPELVKTFTACVKNNVKIPVISKMTPNITHIEEPAAACMEAGADAISAINTIKSITMDTDAEVAGQRTVSGYSGRAVRPIALRYVLELTKMEKRPVISGIGGIETWRDALEFIQLGCSNVQVCTAVMQYGYRIIEDLILGLQRYMAKRGVSDLQTLVGEEIPKFFNPDNLDRSTVIYPKFDKELCLGCGRCEISCNDGGHQAIVFDHKTRRPQLIGSKCVGCHLCRLVCPAGAIGLSKRIPKKKA